MRFPICARQIQKMLSTNTELGFFIKQSNKSRQQKYEQTIPAWMAQEVSKWLVNGL